MKYGKKIIILLLIFLAVSIFICYRLNPYLGSTSTPKNTLDLSDKLTREEAIQDIDYVEKTIASKHMSTADGLSSKMIQTIENEKDNLDDEVTVLNLWQSISRILSVLQDAHTNIKPCLECDKYLECDFFMDNSDLYLIDNDDDKKIRRRVYSINGKSIEQLYDNFLQMFSYENEYYARTAFCSYIKSYSGLEFLNLFDESDEYENSVTIELENKNNRSVIEKKNYEFISPNNLSDSKSRDVYFSIDPIKSVGVLTINKCEFNDNYKKILKDFFNSVNDNDISNIAIDLRENTGGDSAVIDEFMQYLDIDSYKWFKTEARYSNFILPSKQIRKISHGKDNKYSNNIFVLTSNKTFSSAMMFSVVLQDNNIAKVIGEPSGNMPTSYGDQIKFSLPNSKLLLSVSYKKFTRPDNDLSDEKYQNVDYPCESSKALDELYSLVDG